MPETFKVLAQTDVAAATDTDLYTVPASTQAIVSSIVVANRGAAGTYRLWVAINGAATADGQYLAFDRALGANDTHVFAIGITLGDTDVIRVRASTTDFTFSAFGVELT